MHFPTVSCVLMEWRRDSFPFSSLARKPHAWAIDMNDLRLGPETEGIPPHSSSIALTAGKCDRGGMRLTDQKPKALDRYGAGLADDEHTVASYGTTTTAQHREPVGIVKGAMGKSPQEQVEAWMAGQSYTARAIKEYVDQSVLETYNMGKNSPARIDSTGKKEKYSKKVFLEDLQKVKKSAITAEIDGIRSAQGCCYFFSAPWWTAYRTSARVPLPSMAFASWAMPMCFPRNTPKAEPGTRSPTSACTLKAGGTDDHLLDSLSYDPRRGDRCSTRARISRALEGGS